MVNRKTSKHANIQNDYCHIESSILMREKFKVFIKKNYNFHLQYDENIRTTTDLPLNPQKKNKLNQQSENSSKPQVLHIK